MTGGRIASIITCRDLGRSLAAALESVQRQTRPAAELVIVDDASADVYTQQVLATLEQAGTRVVRAGGNGAAAARNLGARRTTAEYVMFLDADDVLSAGYFEAAGEILDRDPSVMFVSSAIQAFGAANYRWMPSRPTFLDAVSTGGVPHASTMLRRELWDQVGGFDEELSSFELLDFWASAFEHGAHGVILEEPYLNYCVRPGSGYRRSIQPGIYRQRMAHFYAKHRVSIVAQALELIQEKEAFLEGQREYHGTLRGRTAAVEGQLAALESEIGETKAALAALGVPAIDLGDVNATRPLSRRWGTERGTPVDRRYIEAFLERHVADIRGRVLEVRDNAYTSRFGGAAVTRSDVIDVDGGNAQATIVADLRRATAVADSAYDCIILTQTLHFIDDMNAVLAECVRMLRPGGVLLVTAPSIIRVDEERGRDADLWRLTEASARMLFARAFGADAFVVEALGNVLTATAFLQGLAAEELLPACFEEQDPDFPVVIAVRAVKPRALPAAIWRSGMADTGHAALVLAYHRVASLSPDSHGLCTPPEVLRAHLGALSSHFRPMALADLIEASARGRIPDRAVAVTFDDGYVDALTTAAPILEEFGIPATCFVCSERLDEEHERWWDQLEELFLGERTLPASLEVATAVQLSLPCRTRLERQAALERLNEAAWALDADSRLALVAGVLAWGGGAVSCRPTHRVMTADDLRTLAARPGMTIGAHTVHHLALSTQPIAIKRREVVEDKNTLERVIGRPVDLFAYPYGDHDVETRGVVSAAGYRAAFTVEEHCLRAATNRLLIPRVEAGALRDDFLPRLRAVFERGRHASHPPSAGQAGGVGALSVSIET